MYLALAYIIINLSVYEFINFRYMNVTLNNQVCCPSQSVEILLAKLEEFARETEVLVLQEV